MIVTRETRLVELFDLPERIFVAASARGLRTVGKLLDWIQPAPNVLVAAYELFCEWCFWFHSQECQDAALLLAGIAESIHAADAERGAA